MTDGDFLRLPLLGRNSVKLYHQSEIKQCYSGILIPQRAKSLAKYVLHYEVLLFQGWFWYVLLQYYCSKET